MELIPFDDTCVIVRSLRSEDGTVVLNEYDEPQTEEVYSGVCCFQKGAQGLSSVITRGDMVYIPSGVMLKVGDIVSVSAQFNGEHSGVVSNSKVITLAISGKQLTRVGIEQVAGQ